MSIFPFLDNDLAEEDLQVEVLPVFKLYDFDFVTNSFVYENGRMKVVEKDEALKVWIMKALLTVRYRYVVYDWEYGNEAEELIGSSFTNKAILSEITRHISDCLLINPYITKIKNVQLDTSKEKLFVSFTVETIYKELNINVEL